MVKMKMLKKLVSLLIIIVLGIVMLFFSYNAFFLDRSLANLKITLREMHKAEAFEEIKKLAPLLHFSLLKEMALPELNVVNVAKIELALDILTNPRALIQLNDVQFALEEVIKDKEKGKPALLLALDKINMMFIPPVLEMPRAIAFSQKPNIGKRAQFYLAWNERLSGNLEEAIKEFQLLAQLAVPDELSIFSQYQLAETLRQKQDLEQAITFYNQVAAQTLQLGLAQIARLQLGYLYLYDIKDYEKAKEVFDKTKAEVSDARLAAYIEKTAMPAVAKGYYRDGIDLLKEGFKVASADSYKEALEKCDRALEINPHDAKAYSAKALAHYWLKEPEKAMDSAKEAVKISPQDEMANVNLGYIYIKLNLIDETITEYKKFISLNPSTFMTYYNLGYAYSAQDNYKEAYDAFSKAIKINSQFHPGHNNQGWCLWKMGRYAEAMEAVERALSLDPQFQHALFNLSIIYASIGKEEEAKTQLSILLSINPEYLQARLNLKKIEKAIEQKRK